MKLSDEGFEVIDIARNLVALWKNPTIRELPRSERNAAIEDTRKRLIEAVDKLEAKL